MQPASSGPVDRAPSALRKWGPVAAIAAIAVVIVGVVLLTGGDDGDEISSNTDPSTSEPATSGSAAANPPAPVTDGDATAPATDAVPATEPADVPDALSFSQAKELGIEVAWDERCDIERGTIAVPDYFAAECFAPFAGDNGGATSAGVTGDTIRIVYYQSPEDDPIINYITDALAIDETNEQEATTIQGMIEYYEAYYETYGRTVELVPYVSSGLANDEVTARSDAVRIAEDIEPFMVWGGPALTNAFADELAARGVLCLACTPAQPPQWYVERDPYVWGIDATARQKQSHAAEFIAKQLAGKPAEFGGDGVVATTRVFGVLYLETGAESKAVADEFVAELGESGVEVAETVSYLLDPASIQQTASQAIAKMKDAGVTTILFNGDPIAPRDFTREATAQSYFPEWILTAPTLNDTNAFARTYDQEQWQHAFGISTGAARLEPTQTGYYRLYIWFHGEEPPAKDQIGVLAPLPAVFYAVLQGVGPDLTREAWAAALGEGGTGTRPAISQPFLSWGQREYWPYYDYSGIDDATLVWWDPTAIGPDEIRREDEGMWQFADGGTRYLPGGWPATSSLFDPSASVTLYTTTPPGEAPPEYPSPAG